MALERILFAVLDWGLGHATRSVPLIDHLLTQGCEVVIAGRGSSLHWLRERFPQLESIEKPDAAIRYTRYANALTIAGQGPRFLALVQEEKRWTKDMVERYGFTQLYSDNCYGVKHPALPSVLITHQLHLPVPPLMRRPADWLLRQLLAEFTEIRVPDFGGDRSLAGRLSAPRKGFPVRYIGPISQFTTTEDRPLQEVVPYVALLSGPEPHRSLLEKDLIERFRELEAPAAIFGGAPGQPDFQVGSVRRYANAAPDLIKAHLLQAKEITCRSGYSTVMDLHVLGLLDRVVRWEPTPGQWEQQYLAKRFNQRFNS